MIRSATSRSLLLSLPAALIIVVCLLIPVTELLLTSVRSEGGGLSLEHYRNYLDGGSVAREGLVVSLTVSFWTVLFCVLIGVPFGIRLAKSGARVRAVLTIFLFLPLLTSEVVLAYGWLIVFGRKGLVNRVITGLGLSDDPLSLLYSPTAVVVGLTCLLLPFVAIPVATARSAINPELYRAAAVLGAGPIRSVLSVTLRSIAGAIASGAFVVYALAMSAYAVPLVLGGTNVHVTTILIYTEYMVLFDRPLGSAMALVLLVVVLVPSLLVLRGRSMLTGTRS